MNTLKQKEQYINDILDDSSNVIGEIYYYKVYIDGKRTDFRGKNQSIDDLKKKSN